MALNGGFAVDAQGRRIYFPPIGRPRLVPSTLDEAKFNGAVFTYALITFGLGFVVHLTASAAYGEYAGLAWVWAAVLVVYPLAASLRARRWPALDNPNYTYHRFVISTLRRQSTVWLRCKLIASAILAIGLVLVAGSFAIKLQSEWAIWSLGDRVDRLLISPASLAAGLLCAIHAYRIHVAVRRQRELRASAVELDRTTRARELP
jgi:hypothetical protein